MSINMHSTSIFLSLLFALTAAQDPTQLSSYPFCAAQCQVEVFSGPFNPCGSNPGSNLTCTCAPDNRALTAACETVSCSPADYTKTQTLAEQLCSPPFYSSGTISAASVSAAISAATASASAAVAGKDATNPNNYPACATACQKQTIPQSGCGSLSNVSCVCGNAALNDALGACETKTCSTEDRRTTRYLAFALCKSAGGLGNASAVTNQTLATQTGTPSLLVPSATGSVVPFTGGAGSSWGVGAGGWVVVAAALGSLYFLV
ncbi:hypothetical protein G7Y79_00016g040280 [Physcia stellaris]|nr:hypothetical protein G7Y79_00016g040280 [Physcia stellaris]